MKFATRYNGKDFAEIDAGDNQEALTAFMKRDGFGFAGFSRVENTNTKSLSVQNATGTETWIVTFFAIL